MKSELSSGLGCMVHNNKWVLKSVSRDLIAASKLFYASVHDYMVHA